MNTVDYMMQVAEFLNNTARISRLEASKIKRPFSEFILPTRERAAQVRRAGTAVVSAYAYEGRVRYTKPLKHPHLKPKSSVLYRIRIRMK